MFEGLISARVSTLWFPFTSWPDQATFTPGAVLLAMGPQGSPSPQRWPAPASIGDRRFTRIRVPRETTHFIALTTAVDVDGTWLSAQFLPPDGSGNPGRHPLWRVWPLEEWAGPSAPLDQDAWDAIDPTTSVASPLPPSTVLPLGAVNGARIRVTTSDPWFANRPALRIDPSAPWDDLRRRWSDLLALLGYADPTRARGPLPEDLRPNPDWWLIGSGNANDPRLGSLRLENTRGLDHLPGWSDWCKEWDGNPYERPTEHLDRDQKGLVRASTLWVLDEDGTLLPLRSSLTSPQADAPRGLNDPRYRAAASIHLAVARGATTLCAHALRPREYSASAVLDLDPERPEERRAPISRLKEEGWGSADRFGDIDLPRSSVDSVHATVVGVGPFHGGTTIPLPSGSDLSALFERPELIIEAMRTLRRVG